MSDFTEIVLTGTYKDFEKILNLLESGEIEQTLGMSGLEIEAVSRYQPTPPQPISYLDQWLQPVTNAIESVWNSESVLLGTFSALKEGFAAIADRETFYNELSTVMPAYRSDRLDMLQDLLEIEEIQSEIQFGAAIALVDELDLAGEEAEPEFIAKLADRLSNSERDTQLSDKQIALNWQIALTLGQLVPDHPKAAIAKQKEIQLGENNPLELLIALKRRDNGEIEIWLQTYSPEEEPLQPGLKLEILDENEDIVLETEVGESDREIHLSFPISPERPFRIKITDREASFTERFVFASESSKNPTWQQILTQQIKRARANELESILALVPYNSTSLRLQEQISQIINRERLRFNLSNFSNLRHILTSEQFGKQEGTEVRAGGPTKAKDRNLTALIPQHQLAKNTAPFVLGLTTRDRPTFWFYIPYGDNSPRNVEFSLIDEDEEEIYEETFQFANTPGIVSISLPETTQPLEIDRSYYWTFSFIYDPRYRDADDFVAGWIVRTLPTTELRDRIASCATEWERALLYANNGFWYDAIAILGELRSSREQTSETTLDSEWKERVLIEAYWFDLLASVELGELSEEKIVN